MQGTEEFKRREKEAELAGGKDRINKQHAAGKLTARERVMELVDPDTFCEFDKFVTHRSEHFGIKDQKFFGDGVITGTGKINGRQVFLFSQDFTVFGGSLSETYANKIVKIMDLALTNGCPLIGLNDSGGARIQEGVQSLAGYAEIFYRNVQCSGVIPQFSLIMGPCAGGAVYSPAITDFIFMVDKTSHMFITGPDVIKAVTKEDVGKDDLGGALTHSAKSGVAHFVSANDKACIKEFRNIFQYIPQNNLQQSPQLSTNDILNRETKKILSIIPESTNLPYDMKDIIAEIADDGKFDEVQRYFAQNIIIGFISLAGQSVGIVANQPKVLAGCLDIDASTKAARFVRFCDAFNIPLLTLVDIPGFLPGIKQEHGGIIRHGAKLLYAFAEATVPKVTLITRKAYGGAYDVMSSKHIRGDINLAYPCAEIAVMGPEGAVNIIFRKEIDTAIAEGTLEETRRKLIDDYREKFSNPWSVASLGFIDSVIDPANTRKILINSFQIVKNKSVVLPKRKHGNIPL